MTNSTQNSYLINKWFNFRKSLTKLKLRIEKGNNSGIIKHKTKRKVLIKFLLILSIFILYFIFITHKYGIKEGFFVSILSWSFFVLSTPIADAGFLIDFPLRLITKIKMIFSEMFIWIIAISLNTYAIIVTPEIYDTTTLLKLFGHIIQTPFPYWIIFVLSMLGTFISIQFGDELLTTFEHKDREFYKKHHKKYKVLLMFFLFLMIITIYNFLLKGLGISIFKI